MNKIWLISILFIILVTLSGCGVIEDVDVKGESVEVSKEILTKENIYQRSFIMDRDYFDVAYDNSFVLEERQVKAGIIPHHLLAKFLIADFFQGIDYQSHPSVVVVIGPNHKNIGHSDILTSEAYWNTPYGDLEPSSDLINSLIKNDVVSVDERIFSEEHSISAHVSFVKKSFPNAGFIPIILKDSTSKDDTDLLAENLSRLLPSDALVLASVDFSHEKSSEVSQEQDAVSIEILLSQNMERVGEITVDSIPTINTLFKYLEHTNTTNSSLLSNSDTSIVIDDPSLNEVTSYITMYFMN